MVLLTLCPGSCPPSPGFAPWAILICSSSALTRYSAVTPKRPDATCLIAERIESPFGERHEALGLLAALAGVRAPAEAVHGDRERGVRLVGQSAPNDIAPVCESLDDLARGLDLVERYRLIASDSVASSRPAQIHHASRRAVHR